MSVVLFYGVTSLSLNFLNKAVVSSYDFNFPFFIMACQVGREKNKKNFHFKNVLHIQQMLLTITLFSSAYLLDLVPRTLLGPYTWKQGISSFSSVDKFPL